MMKKRLVSVILTFCMSVSLLSGGMTAFAAGETGDVPEAAVDSYDDEETYTDTENKEDKGLSEPYASFETYSVDSYDDEEAYTDTESKEDKELSEPYASIETYSVDESGAVEIQCMDEFGNITYITDDVDPYVEEVGLFSFNPSNTTKVVNLRNPEGDLVYYDEYETGIGGYLHGSFGADAAYLGEENGNVKFMISGIIGVTDADNVQVCSAAGTHVSYYTVSDGRLVHVISSNLNAEPTSRLGMGPAPSYLKEGGEYYGYDGHYFYDNYETMLKDYQSGVRTHAINEDNPFYSYFQFLPIRSKTNYSADRLSEIINSKVSSDSKMRDMGPALIAAQEKYGVNALLMAGVSANESAWGMSHYAKTRNNLFGLKATDSNPDNALTFESVEQCVNEFAGKHISNGFLDSKYDWRYFGGVVGDKGTGINVKYASDPYWGEKAANVASNLDVDGIDRGYYTIGIKDTINSDHTTVNIRKEANTSSNIIYTTKEIPNYPVLIIGEANGFYRIQSDGCLNSDRTDIVDGDGSYSFTDMYGYISKDYVTKIDSGATDNKPVEPLPTTGPLTSGDLKINADDGIISGAYKFPMTKDELRSKLSVSDKTMSIEITPSMSDGSIGTGTKVKVKDANGNVIKTYTLIVYGDNNGDGKINALDLLRVKKQILGVIELNSDLYKGADTNRNGKVDALDLLKIQKEILGIQKIAQ